MNFLQLVKIVGFITICLRVSNAYTQIAPSFKFPDIQPSGVSLKEIPKLIQLEGELGAQAAASSPTTVPFSGFLGFTYRTGINHQKDLQNLHDLIIRDPNGNRKTISSFIAPPKKFKQCISEFFRGCSKIIIC